MDRNWVDACSELLVAATRLREHLPLATRQGLAPLPAHMNCYYSNLIEGHRTYPGAVEQAVQGGDVRTAANDQQRFLVHEAVAHIQAQAEVHARLRVDPAWEPVAAESLAWMHQVFYGHLPDECR